MVDVLYNIRQFVEDNICLENIPFYQTIKTNFLYYFDKTSYTTENFNNTGFTLYSNVDKYESDDCTKQPKNEENYVSMNTSKTEPETQSINNEDNENEEIRRKEFTLKFHEFNTYCEFAKRSYQKWLYRLENDLVFSLFNEFKDDDEKNCKKQMKDSLIFMCRLFIRFFNNSKINFDQKKNPKFVPETILLKKLNMNFKNLLITRIFIFSLKFEESRIYGYNEKKKILNKLVILSLMDMIKIKELENQTLDGDFVLFRVYD